MLNCVKQSKQWLRMLKKCLNELRNVYIRLTCVKTYGFNSFEGHFNCNNVKTFEICFRITIYKCIYKHSLFSGLKNLHLEDLFLFLLKNNKKILKQTKLICCVCVCCPSFFCFLFIYCMFLLSFLFLCVLLKKTQKQKKV